MKYGLKIYTFSYLVKINRQFMKTKITECWGSNRKDQVLWLNYFPFAQVCILGIWIWNGSSNHCGGWGGGIIRIYKMYSRECLLPDTKGHPESRLAKLSSSDTETAKEMNLSDKRHPQLNTFKTDYLKYFNIKYESTWLILSKTL